MHRCVSKVMVTVLVYGAAAGSVGAQTSGAAGADRQFLRDMADLNRGIALLAHETMHRAGTFPSKADAQKVDSKHDDEMDHIRAAQKMLNDTYTPKASAEDAAMATALGKESGAAYDRTFRADVAKLDQKATQVIDKYLPQLGNAQIKTLAQRMRDGAVAEGKELGGSE